MPKYDRRIFIAVKPYAEKLCVHGNLYRAAKQIGIPDAFSNWRDYDNSS
ncbi:hypothetical protein OHAE_2740 [Ochrobactrum soli]|uniref:Uncharacterized protein n=1 Tax=Ochrobactrum soli TaxID=2448455 RepID=A0A2P9HFE2_9HYPH|nr:hypothetical protein OHAE_2740 [[Ochrobactrum] soli]